MNIEKHISLLEIIKQNPQSGQRDLAEAVGLSLGMTNILLKELAAKGWLMIRKINARNFNYFLTPEGVKEVSKRSYRYIKKTIRSLADCREQLETFIVATKEKGFLGVVLYGKSDLDFVVEFLCQKHQLKFIALAEAETPPPEYFLLYSESVPHQEPNLLEFVSSGDANGL